MIVELVGLPGAGKTTLHRYLRRVLDAAGRSYLTPQSLRRIPAGGGRRSGLPNRLAVAARHRAALRIATATLLRSERPWQDRRFGLKLFWIALENHDRARRHLEAEVFCLFDEGLVQRAFTLFVDGRGTAPMGRVRSYARSIPPADLLLHIEVEPEVALERISGRPRGLPYRLEIPGALPPMEILARASRMLATLVAELAALAGPRLTVVHLEADEPARFENQADSLVVPHLQGLSRMAVCGQGS